MSAPTISRKSKTLLAPTEATQNMPIEYSVHTLGPSFKTDLSCVFPSHTITRISDILLVPTMQTSSLDLLAFGKEEAREKDRLLETFFEWSSLVRDAIHRCAPNAWVDVTDPASGVARWGARGSVYPDVDGFSRVLKYPTVEVGGCRVLKHPRWGFSCYPASLFTDAPFDVLRNALKEVSGA